MSLRLQCPCFKSMLDAVQAVRWNRFASRLRSRLDTFHQFLILFLSVSKTKVNKIIRKGKCFTSRNLASLLLRDP